MWALKFVDVFTMTLMYRDVIQKIETTVGKAFEEEVYRVRSNLVRLAIKLIIVLCWCMI